VDASTIKIDGTMVNPARGTPYIKANRPVGPRTTRPHHAGRDADHLSVAGSRPRPAPRSSAGVPDATQCPGLSAYASAMLSTALERRVLTAPDTIARAAARYAADSEQAWMLRQPHALRRSFAVHAFGCGETAEQIWMLRQDDDVRDAYVREVLGG
jgi:hypothetical protein